ncbi:MAG: hypothetical protein R3B82_24330 [Sandaracinaceae bacterium]
MDGETMAAAADAMLDAANPLGGLFERGASFERSVHTSSSSVTVSGVPVSSSSSASVPVRTGMNREAIPRRAPKAHQ